MNYYLINLLVYAAVDAIACLGLSQQFGVAGVTNFGFIIFQAAGGYTAAILALPADTANGGFQSYIGGWQLPFPLPWIGAAVVGGVLALPFTFLVGRRLRGDFAAVGLLVTAVLFNLLATNYRPALNGAAGLSLIPPPLASAASAAGGFSVQAGGYQWAFTTTTWSPVSRWGAKVALCLPRRRVATVVARRPSTTPSAGNSWASTSWKGQTVFWSTKSTTPQSSRTPFPRPG